MSIFLFIVFYRQGRIKKIEIFCFPSREAEKNKMPRGRESKKLKVGTADELTMACGAVCLTKEGSTALKRWKRLHIKRCQLCQLGENLQIVDIQHARSERNIETGTVSSPEWTPTESIENLDMDKLMEQLNSVLPRPQQAAWIKELSEMTQENQVKTINLLLKQGITATNN